MYHEAMTDGVFEEHAVRETPTTLVYDAHGNVASRDVYGARDLPRFATLLNGLLQEGAQAASSQWGI